MMVIANAGFIIKMCLIAILVGFLLAVLPADDTADGRMREPSTGSATAVEDQRDHGVSSTVLDRQGCG